MEVLKASQNSTLPAPLLLDGGTGSELRRRGVWLDERTWSAGAVERHADLLRRIHLDYLHAGADVITANTFAASPIVLDAAGLMDQFEAINRLAIAAAQDAVKTVELKRGDALAGPADPSAATAAVQRYATGGRARVAASLSCYPPGGAATRWPSPAAELAAYRQSVALFEDAGTDLIVVEMMQEPRHAAGACAAAADSGLPFWLGLSCRRVGSGLAGFDYPDASFVATLSALADFGPDAITVMHAPLDTVDEALGIIRSQGHSRFGAYPALPYPADPSPPDLPHDPVSPARLAAHARRWLDAGASIIGGCCGSTPSHIRALRAAITTVRGC